MTKKTAIMNFVQARGGTVRRKEIVQFISELNGTPYDPVKSRGYYSSALCPTSYWSGGYLFTPNKNEPRYLVRQSRGVYKVERFNS